MKKIFYYVCTVLILAFSSQAISDTVYYEGTMKVRDSIVPAKATYEETESLPEPIIKITYKISGKKYFSRYMSNFGDKVIYKPGSITVYNDSAEKKQNYHFKGKEVSWLKSFLPSN